MMIMLKYLEYYYQNSKMSLVTSQIIGYILCIYFILNNHKYEIQMNFWLPILTEKVNNILVVVGTYILIIPLIIITLANTISKNQILKLISEFWGIMTTVGLINLGLVSLTSYKAFDTKIFIITKLLTLEEKRIIFKTEYCRIVDEMYNSSLEFYEYLQEFVDEDYFSYFDQYLELLHNYTEIQIYVNEVIVDIVLAHEYEPTFFDKLEHFAYKNPIIEISLLFYCVTYIVLLIDSLR
jgi:hypothetical protein